MFMIGGGNYLEYESLVTWAGRATPPKSIVYGATDLLSGEQVSLWRLLTGTAMCGGAKTSKKATGPVCWCLAACIGRAALPKRG